MLISVPVLSDRLKFKQTLPWAPLPNSCQSNTTINKGIFPTSLRPWRFSPSFFHLSSYSPWQSIQHLSNRRCLNLSAPSFHTEGFLLKWSLIPTTHPTRSCIRIFRFECPIRQQGHLQTMHGRRTRSHLAPSYSLTSFPQRHSHLCEEASPRQENCIPLVPKNTLSAPERRMCDGGKKSLQYPTFMSGGV